MIVLAVTAFFFPGFSRGTAWARVICSQEPGQPRACTIDIPDEPSSSGRDDGGGNDQYYQPAPPQLDARAAARSRIAALIANYSDVIDQGRWGNVAATDDARFDAALGDLHHELWWEMGEAQVAVADRRPQIASYSDAFKDFQDREARLNGDRVGQELIAAKADLLSKKAALEAQIGESEPDGVHDDTAAAYARSEWLTARNDIMKRLRTALPGANLPDATSDAFDLWQPHQPFVTDLPIDPPTAPPAPLMPRQYSLFADIDLTHVYSPPPEPVPSADLIGRVAELEQIAGQTRSARQELKAVQDANAACAARYNGLAQSVAQREAAVESVTRDVTFLDAEIARLGQQLQKANAEERAAAWMKTLDSLRAATWDIMREKVVMPEIERLPHYADYDRAKKSAELVKHVMSLENDAELYSTAAAETLALGPTSHTAEISAKVWGATRQQAEASIDRTMDLIEAPTDLKTAWKALLISEP